MPENFEYHPPEEPNREAILEGRGWEEIERVGWESYRQELEKVSYGEIASRRIGRIRELEALPLPPNTGKTSPGSLQALNDQAKVRSYELSASLSQEHSREKGGSWHAFRQGDKKLTARGQLNPRNERGEPVERPIRRFYFSVLTRKAPEAYQSLLSALAENGAIDNIDLVLNLETFQEPDPKSFENNALILYSFGNDAELMNKIATAVRQAKESSPDAWSMGANDKGRAMNSVLRDFLVPLDDTSGFVEMPTTQSYHSGTRGHIYEEMVGEPSSRGTTTEEIAKRISMWKPEKPGLFLDSSLRNRRRYMPALLFEEASAA